MMLYNHEQRIEASGTNPRDTCKQIANFTGPSISATSKTTWHWKISSFIGGVESCYSAPSIALIIRNKIPFLPHILHDHGAYIFSFIKNKKYYLNIFPNKKPVSHVTLH